MALAGDPLARAMFGDESWLDLAVIAEAEYQADPAAREWAAQYRKRQRKGRKK